MTPEKQKLITAAVERKIHRIRGLLINIGSVMDEVESHAVGADWGTFGSLDSVEYDLSVRVAQYMEPAIFSQNEDLAREMVLANVDPEGEPHGGYPHGILSSNRSKL